MCCVRNREEERKRRRGEDGKEGRERRTPQACEENLGFAGGIGRINARHFEKEARARHSRTKNILKGLGAERGSEQEGRLACQGVVVEGLNGLLFVTR